MQALQASQFMSKHLSLLKIGQHALLNTKFVIYSVKINCTHRCKDNVSVDTAPISIHSSISSGLTRNNTLKFIIYLLFAQIAITNTNGLLCELLTPCQIFVERTLRFKFSK